MDVVGTRLIASCFGCASSVGTRLIASCFGCASSVGTRLIASCFGCASSVGTRLIASCFGCASSVGTRLIASCFGCALKASRTRSIASLQETILPVKRHFLKIFQPFFLVLIPHSYSYIRFSRHFTQFSPLKKFAN